MLAVDTETTGKDLWHGAKPFFVTTCDEQGNQRWWEWDVDPRTRQPLIPEEDLQAVRFLIENKLSEELVLQNAKFDAAALGTILPGLEWPWQHTYDTLRAGHLLASNHRHDLTAMALNYLDEDIEPLEQALKAACVEARRIAKRDFPEWRIAKEGLPEMPSAKSGQKTGREDKDPVWKYDSWLPRCIARTKRYPKDHPWHTVLRDYSNGDSAVTMGVFLAQRRLLQQKNLWTIYLEALKANRIAWKMESDGVTVSGVALGDLEKEYGEAVGQAAQTCLKIARGRGYELELPKGASPNGSLRRFCFDVLKLPPQRNPKAKSDAPSLDGKALEFYQLTLGKGDALDFITTLMAKRKRDTALTYMAGYRKFWQPLGRQLGWFLIHPSLNPTGTDTLRWSSSNPNEQNISDKEDFNLRRCFGPAPGREWWSLDGKNLELRVAGYESEEQDLINLFERSNDPPFYGSEHLLNFSVVYPDIWAELLAQHGLEGVGAAAKKTPWYKRCKNGDFAVGYGAILRAGGMGTADRAFGRPGCHALLVARFAKKEQLNRKYISMANRLGYVETIPDKEVDPQRGYPLLCSRSEEGRIIPTVPLNYHIQGTACWWMLRGMIKVQEYLDKLNRELPGDFRLTLQVHDELVLDFPKGRGAEPWRTNLPRVRAVKRLMESCGDAIGVPTPVSIEYHAVDWSQGKIIH